MAKYNHDETVKCYYEAELDKLGGNVKVKFTSDAGETNYLDLNDESCKAIAKLLLSITKDKQIIV